MMGAAFRDVTPARDPLGTLAETLWRPMGVEGVYGRTGAYEVRAGYLNQNYYNFLPLWSNPLRQEGWTLSQHGLDVGYRNTDVELKLFTTNWVRPFFGLPAPSDR